MTITLPHFPALSKLSQSAQFQHLPNWRVSATRDLLICMFIGVLAILPLDALVFRYGIYYSDMIYLLQSVSMRSLVTSIQGNTRPIEYFIVLAANDIYLPLWFVASLVCVVGATVLAGLACEIIFDRRLPPVAWWILVPANGLLVHVAGLPNTLSQALCNLLFAGAIFAFVSELYRLPYQQPAGWRADWRAVVLNVIAAALFFTKELAVAAGVILPAAAFFIRLRAGRLSPLFLTSLFVPIGAAIGWILINLNFPTSRLYSLQAIPTTTGHYSLKFNPFTWLANFIITLAFPVTPLPNSFLEFEILRQLWVVVALVSVAVFVGIVWRSVLRQPKSVLPLFVIAASCAPMILIKPSELYSSMIAPFAVSIVFLFLSERARWLILTYGLLLYAASVANTIVYSSGAHFDLLGLQRIPYSIYDKSYQKDPICPVATTAHVAWSGTAVTCVR